MLELDKLEIKGRTLDEKKSWNSIGGVLTAIRLRKRASTEKSCNNVKTNWEEKRFDFFQFGIRIIWRLAAWRCWLAGELSFYRICRLSIIQCSKLQFRPQILLFKYAIFFSFRNHKNAGQTSQLLWMKTFMAKLVLIWFCSRIISINKPHKLFGLDLAELDFGQLYSKNKFRICFYNLNFHSRELFVFLENRPYTS